MEFQRLTVLNYSDDPTEEKRITIGPGHVTLIAADTEDVVIKGRNLRRVTLMFTDGGSVDLTINHADLDKLEAAIGSYYHGFNEN